jgi:hypothetical protein
MKLNIARVAALGPLGIGILFTALGNGACAAGSSAPNSGSSEGVGKNTQATITPLSLNTDGACNAVGAWGITSPQVISFIAANASAFKNAQFQLLVQKQNSSTMTTATSAVTASASFENMLQAAASASAAQAATAIQSAQASALNSAMTTANATEADTTTISGSATSSASSLSSVMHHDQHFASASGSANNTAITSSTANNSASGMNGNSNSLNSTFLQTAFNSATVPAFFGGIGLLPVSNSSSASTTNTSLAVNTAFFNNMAQAGQAATAANSSQFNTASSSSNDTVDVAQQMTNSGSQFQQTLTHNLSAQNGTLAVTAATSGSNSSLVQNSGSNQGSTNTLDQSGSSFNTQQTQVFNDLETMNSNTFVLVAKLEASQANTILQIFQGSNNAVTGDGNFPVVLPNCGN